ncbi:MAG TPA: hypothetical protein PLN13_09275 [Bacteroidia bacterium]|nr:hypothetical protein [Bacteroidia bacterium]HRH08759.1 hypothetical protein [Bacteroidia bacterium]
MLTHKLEISETLWVKLVGQLRIRGKGKRETGAFLLGPLEKPTITKFICYDELDPHAFDSGIIVFSGDGYIPLWKYCRENNLRVWADVHTHPGTWTGQSKADKEHPMISQKGHIAFIVPNFAKNKKQKFTGVGIYEYLGDHKWKIWTSNSSIIKLIVEKNER